MSSGKRTGGAGAPSSGPRAWQQLPVLPLGLIGLLLAFTLFEPVRGNPRLSWTFWGVAGALAAWSAILWVRFRRRGGSFRIESLAPQKSHYIQASVQSCVYAYWGWYWGAVYSEVPLILAQMVFLYTLDGLLSWSRGRSWRLGLGPLPIILSTNLFLWFKDDWFVFQFLLVATSALAKEFIRWERDGRLVHVFNPSAFGLALFSIVLLATGTSDATWVGSIADTFDKPPQIYVVVFLVGLVVQFFFSTTLMTFSAVATLCLLNWIYTSSTGTYFFVFTNIPAPVFLGLHLLVTDPATSPRSNAGKVIFGALYGLGTFACYGILSALGEPGAYDKLLPVPLLNLSLGWIERLRARGAFGALDRWSNALQPRKLNLASMGAWMALFAVLLNSGYVQGHQAGATLQFWQQACAEGKFGAPQGLVAVLEGLANEGNADALDELGLIHLEGKLVARDPERALHYFARASQLGSLPGSANVVYMFLGSESAPTSHVVEAALEQLEQACAQGTDAPIYHLVARAYETGRLRPVDPLRALALYQEGCTRGSPQACEGAQRIAAEDPGAAGAAD